MPPCQEVSPASTMPGTNTDNTASQHHAMCRVFTLNVVTETKRLASWLAAAGNCFLHPHRKHHTRQQLLALNPSKLGRMLPAGCTGQSLMDIPPDMCCLGKLHSWQFPLCSRQCSNAFSQFLLRFRQNSIDNLKFSLPGLPAFLCLLAWHPIAIHLDGEWEYCSSTTNISSPCDNKGIQQLASRLSCIFDLLTSFFDALLTVMD